MPPSIVQIITELANIDQPLSNTGLAELSSLGPVDLEFFKQVWPSTELKRRRHIVHRLIELAETNVELNFDTIFKYCLNDDDAEVQSQAIEGLWENKEASLINPLINLLERASSQKAQAAAANALGKFAMMAEHKKLRACHVSRIQEALLSAVTDQNKALEVRHRALEAMAPLSLPEVKSAIRDAYQGPSPRLKISAIYAMGKNCHPSWLPILLKELTNADAETRYEATVACGEIAEEEAVP